MNIVYNGDVTEKQLELFKLMEEFMCTNLKDKSLFYKITIHFKEVEDKSNGLSYIGLCTFRPSKPFEPVIKISDYAIRLSSNAYILSGKKLFNSYEKYRSKVIFHELGHVVVIFNDAELFHIMTRYNGDYFDKVEEDNVNILADEFLKLKNLI